MIYMRLSLYGQRRFALRLRPRKHFGTWTGSLVHWEAKKLRSHCLARLDCLRTLILWPGARLWLKICHLDSETDSVTEDWLECHHEFVPPLLEYPLEAVVKP